MSIVWYLGCRPGVRIKHPLSKTLSLSSTISVLTMSRGDGGARCVVLANCVDGGAHAGSSSIVRAFGQMTVSPMPQRPEVAAASAAADPAANVTAAARCVVLATDSVLNAAKAIVRQVSSMPRRAQSSRPAGLPAEIAHGIRMANRLSRRTDRRGSIAKRSPRNYSTLVGLSDEQLKLMAAHLEQRQQLLQLHLEQRQQLLQLATSALPTVAGRPFCGEVGEALFRFGRFTNFTTK